MLNAKQNINVAIHCEPGRQWNAWLWRLEKILLANGIPTTRVCSSDEGFWDTIRRFTHFFYLWGQWDRSEQNARDILPVIENDLGIACFPDAGTSRMFDNKIQQSLFLKMHGLPTPKAWSFWEKDAALRWAETTELPVVAKLKGGAGGSRVRLIESRRELRAYIRRIFSRGYNPQSYLDKKGLVGGAIRELLRQAANCKRRRLGQVVSHHLAVPNWRMDRHYAYFQEYMPGNTHDTRILTIGRRAYGFRRNNRPGDFRASGSGLMDYDPRRIDPKALEWALGISRQFDFQSMAYDFVHDKADNPVILEMSYAFADWTPAQCPGHWDASLRWHEGRQWPQVLLLKDMLNLPELNIPPGLDRFDGYERFHMRDHLVGAECAHRPA